MTADYRIYADLADWWPLISPPSEYVHEAAYLAALIKEKSGGKDTISVLDLGSGGGHVAAHLTGGLDLTLVDISAEMLAASMRLVPGFEHIKGDMRTIRLGRQFDAVLVHDAIDYIIGRHDLASVVKTAATHCRQGGIAVFVPDYVKDTFAELTGAGGGGVDGAGRTAAFTEHTWDQNPDDDEVQADYEFTLTDADGTAEVIRESHKLSAYPRDLWRALITDAGLDLEPEPASLPGRKPANIFTARRPPVG
jgi:SAM-dependent methyltransferase